MRWVLIGGLGLLLLGAVGVGALGALGFDPFDNGRTYARTPCNELPDDATVERALAENADLVEELEAVGPNVTVEMGHPCPNDATGAVVRITYSGQDEWDGIMAIMNRSGFGTAVDVDEVDN